MWLALRRGNTELLDDAERYVRARLLPFQITEEQARDDQGVVDRRFWGAWGASRFPQGCPMAYTDVTAAVLHTLCDVYQHIAVRDATGLTVCFHLDYEDDHVRIVSARTHDAKLTVVPKQRKNVLIRIPRWTPLDSVQVTAYGQPIPLTMIGDFAYVPRSGWSEPPEIVVRYDLPVGTTVDMINGTEYCYRWRGDDILGVSPNTDLRPVYPSRDSGETP